MYRKSPLASAISVALAGALGLNHQVLAQEEEEAERQVEEIVVTGSRIRKDVFTSSEPMDVVLTENAAIQGMGSIGGFLQSTTVAAGSPQVTSATSTAFVQNGGTGAETLSLRGLGANRTLTLLNGRRAGPAGTRGGVSSFDLNVLPLSAIERVEILKDGASSIYGSDAVAGVVNIITRKGDGATFDAYTSQPFDSGGEEFRLSASYGKSFSRGNFRVTADYHEESELQKGDRDYFSCGEQYIFDPDTGERRDVIDPRTGNPHCEDLLWGHVWLYDYQGPGGNVPSSLAQFDYDGDLGQYIPGYAVDPDNPDFLVTPPGWFPVRYDRPSDAVANADHPFQDGSSLLPEEERMTIYAEGEFDFTESLTAYTEVLLSRRNTKTNGYRQYWSYIYNENFFGGNPLSAGWTGAQWLSPTPITDHNDSEIEVNYQRFVAGLRGDLTFSESWSWDLSYQYSHSDGDYTDEQIFEDAITPFSNIFNGSGNGSCVGQTTPVRGVPCVDIPWLDPELMRGNVSPEVHEFLFGRETGNTEYNQWSVEGFVTGELFDLPAGPLSAAIGVHYQYDEIHDVPGDITLVKDANGNPALDANGLTFGNGWGTSSAGITSGDDTTVAYFGEVDVPLLTDLPAIKNLTLNASARYTDVDSYGSDTTYKVGLNWQIVDSVRIRANQGTSFRSPALFELYLADQTSFLGQRSVDPCIEWQENLGAGVISQRTADNCAADGIAPDFTGGTVSATIITGGGLGVLEAETSTSRTAGIIWTPEFADLSLSIDYFDIEVEQEVDQLGPGVIVAECYASDFFPNDPLCDLWERRDFDGGITNIRDSFINIATQRNRGWDLSALYRTEVGPGSLTIETQHTYQTEDTKALFADTAEDTNGELGHPEWVGRLNVTYDLQDWSFFWGANIIGQASNYDSFGGNTSTYRGETVRVVLDADTVTYHSFSLSREFADYGLRAIVGVANAFDEAPPQLTTLNLGEVETQGRSAFYSQYDWFGRRLFLNLTKTFE
jgi:outer membrane receptor protein involved in Fe transport